MQSASQWQPIMGSSWTGGSSYPLWYAHYDNNPSFSDFTAFNGWSSPAMKQVCMCSYPHTGHSLTHRSTTATPHSAEVIDEDISIRSRRSHPAAGIDENWTPSVKKAVRAE